MTLKAAARQVRYTNIAATESHAELTRALRWFVDEPARLERASAHLLADRQEFEWPTHVSRLESLFATVVAEAR